MSKLSLRDRLLAAMTEHDNSPIVTPVQLADALALAIETLTETIAPRQQKDWMNKLEIRRKYNLTEYALRKILNTRARDRGPHSDQDQPQERQSLHQRRRVR